MAGGAAPGPAELGPGRDRGTGTSRHGLQWHRDMAFSGTGTRPPPADPRAFPPPQSEHRRAERAAAKAAGLAERSLGIFGCPGRRVRAPGPAGWSRLGSGISWEGMEKPGLQFDASK